MKFFSAFAILGITGLLAAAATEEDRHDRYAFTVESAHRARKMELRPKNFRIEAGKDYFVDCAVLDPRIIRATENGVLHLTVPPVVRGAFLVSELKQNELLVNGSFEDALENYQIRYLRDEEPVRKFDWAPALSEKPQVIEEKKDAVQLSSRARTGKNSLHTVKNSQRGVVRVISRAFPVEPGKTYYVSGYYRPLRYTYASRFGMEARVSLDGEEKFISSDSYNLTPSGYTAPDAWRYAEQTVKVPADWKGRAELRIAVAMHDGPAEVLWDDLSAREAPMVARQNRRELSPEEQKPQITREALLKKLSAMKPYQAKRVIRSGRPMLEVDGKVEPFGPLFVTQEQKIHAPYKFAVQTGIRTIAVTAELSSVWFEHAAPHHIWKGKGQFDFKALDERLLSVLQQAPDARIILYLACDPYGGFIHDYPDAVWRTEDGGTVRPKGGRKVSYSYTAPDTRRELAKALFEVGRHLSETPAGKAVIGMHLCGGDDGQFYHRGYNIGKWNQKFFDYSEGNRQAIIQEIRLMYGNDVKALRKAWNDPAAAFETIRLPRQQELETAEKLLSPIGQGRRLADLVLADYRAIVTVQRHWMDAFKRGIGRPSLGLMYYTGIAQIDVLKAPEMDGFAAVPDYGKGRFSGRSGRLSQIMDSARVHGKFYLIELDYRNDDSIVGDRCNFYRRSGRWLGMAEGGIDGYDSQVRRDYAMALTRGQSAWFHELFGGNSFTGLYRRTLAECVKSAGSAAEKQRDEWGPCAVFFDERIRPWSSYKDGFDKMLENTMNGQLFLPFSLSGVGYHEYLIDDLDHPARPKAQLHVFASSPTMSEKQIRWIEKNLQKDGNVLVFVGDAARTAPGTFEAKLRRLTGMNVHYRPDITVRYRFGLERFSDHLSQYFPGKQSLWFNNARGPLFYVDDSSARPLALIEGTSLVGAAVKRHKNWTALYLGIPGEMSITPELIRALAQECGVTPSGPLGDVTYSGGGMIAIHAATPGVKKLTAPQNRDWIDLTTGKTVRRNSKELTIPMQFGETRFFVLATASRN